MNIANLLIREVIDEKGLTRKVTSYKCKLKISMFCVYFIIKSIDLRCFRCDKHRKIVTEKCWPFKPMSGYMLHIHINFSVWGTRRAENG